MTQQAFRKVACFCLFPIISLASLSLVSCRQRAFNTETTTEGLNAGEVTGPDFHRGLVAKVGSEVRRNAGESFERELREKIFSQLPQPDSQEHLSQVQLTQKALFFTAQYLKYGQDCKPQEKITVYRGHNRPYLKSKTTGLYDVTYAPVWRNKAIRVAEQPWKEWIWDERKVSSPNVAENTKESVLVMGKWSELTKAHSLDSSESLLMSVSLSPEVASTFGPFTAKLEVCPERLWPSSYPKYLSELEFYVPMFLLPEEIISDTASKNAPKYVPSSLSNNTPQLEKCYANFAQKVDFSQLNAESNRLLETDDANLEKYPYLQRYSKISDAFYQAMNLANNSQAWRGWYPNLSKVCETDCALGSATLKMLGDKVSSSNKETKQKAETEYQQYLATFNKMCGQ